MPKHFRPGQNFSQKIGLGQNLLSIKTGPGQKGPFFSEYRTKSAQKIDNLRNVTNIYQIELGISGLMLVAKRMNLLFSIEYFHENLYFLTFLMDRFGPWANGLVR